MTTIAEAIGLSKHYGSVRAVDDVSLRLEEGRIHGLLGRNGAGKSTLMQLLTGQEFPTAGRAEVFGATPAENASVLRNVCFIKESQRYPDDFRPKHVFRSAPWFFEHWDADFAEQLVDEFRLPLNRPIKKLSRGQLSSVGVIVGLASRAPLTFFDEPYLGLDAVARQLFYDRLLADYADHPRTIVLSTHLIDEVSNLLEHVFVIDQGRLLVDESAETLRSSATTLVGRTSVIDEFVAQREVLHREGLGGLASVTVAGLGEAERRSATAAGLELAPVSLQQLVVRITGTAQKEFEVTP
ncbi:ABC-2 type transport system ATP-binding protein [Diaminobutyricimonas aerilata]|uniref:ABC-2 type transport system ATP-binding protein n=1 Tax=Diaminobutyricimonas aerilata TaxID=1162967 RepID=A0A2M9CFV9_9MICO|nr:ABC transporter ATP-binding protein [Diaminobutyricimonas aerilata]PJJ70821.1 ABC-2 type transport system ATP-binding protein [Diaminobutyricimonas aerilata]